MPSSDSQAAGAGRGAGRAGAHADPAGPGALDDVVAAMRAANWPLAERNVRAVLATAPADARALRLLGTICYLTGRLPEAVEQLERARTLAPDDPDVLVNLGAAYLDSERLDVARDCFERVVELDPQGSDGHHSLGLVAQAGGHLETAQRHFERALSLAPQAFDTTFSLALLALRQGRFPASLAYSEQALRLQPGDLQALLTQLKGLIELGRTDAAEGTLRAAEQSLETMPDATRRHAATLRALAADLSYRSGQLDSAAGQYETAVRLGDGRLETALNLARCLLESGQAAAAAGHLRRAASRHREAPRLQELLGSALEACDDAEGALHAYQEALRLAPQALGYLVPQARALYALGQDAAADRLVVRACKALPGAAAPHQLRMERLAARGELQAALEVCEAHLHRVPHECTMLAARGFLLHATGNTQAGAALIDFPRLIRTVRIEAPDGYPDVAAFNRALTEHILAHPSLTHLGAASKATQHGRQSGNLLFGERGPFDAFETLLWQQVEAYRRAMPRDTTHPFLGSAPPLEGVHCWGVVLARAGYQTPHIHPTGWLSGVYYPALPAVIGAGQDAAGWIEFGAPPPALAFERPAPTHRLRPEEGLMVLFPSFLYHRTVPYESDEPRISIAFDFRPEAAPGPWPG